MINKMIRPCLQNQNLIIFHYQREMSKDLTCYKWFKKSLRIVQLVRPFIYWNIFLDLQKVWKLKLNRV